MERMCCEPGCTNPAMVSRDGKHYRKCSDHRSADRKLAVAQHKDGEMRCRDGETVKIMVVDFASNACLIVEGTVCRTAPMPATEGALQKDIARATEQGMFVAKVAAYKPQDLYAV